MAAARKREVYNVREIYEGFVRSVHFKSIEEQKKNRKQWIIDYLKKLLVVAFASLLTTTVFAFLIKPNGILNNGINGLLQEIVNTYFGEQNFSTYYYPLVLIFNLLTISSVGFFYPKTIESSSTAIFYVIFQAIWANIFELLKVNQLFFQTFAVKGGSLPDKFIAVIIASFIHTFAYSLIYKVKASPGGLEIVTSALSQSEKSGDGEKKGFSISQLTSYFGNSVVLMVTIFQYVNKLIKGKGKDINILIGYLQYVTNSPEIWASIVYISLCSLWINQMFPKSVLINIRAIVYGENNLLKILSLLENKEVFYFEVNEKSSILDEESKSDQKVYFVSCQTNKWSYHLISLELKKFAKVSISTVDETS